MNNQITVERLRELLDYDPLVGVFVWRAPTTISIVVGQPAGRKQSGGYIQIGLDGRRYVAQRLAWLYVYGVWPSKFVDHKNGQKDDNRINNLRDVSHQANIENQRAPRKNNLCGFLGVFAHKGKWRAQVCYLGKRIHVGLFSTPEEAHQAYLAKERALHVGCLI